MTARPRSPDGPSSATGADAAIGSAGLYSNLDRIAKGLAALGIGAGDPIAPEQLFPLDQWHYHGTAAIDAAARALGLGPASRAFEIGSGIGGPARYLAHTVGCHVTALELQPKVHAIAADLTRRCGLGGRVAHLCGDALSYPLPDGEFDAALSWLAFLHIPERPRLLARIARALRPGGGCYVEDFCMRAPFSEEGLHDLRDIVFAVTVTSIDDYVRDLRAAGFVAIDAKDMTAGWASFVTARLAAWRASGAAHRAVQGEEAYLAQETFYAAVARLFESGSLGGVRLVARVP
ncbi:MAG TPA: methyltransferase domain-containing protein [Stellaceae bacterium]|nr:methyltransferase domain-containing protein [Stellaceae bacterium]